MPEYKVVPFIGQIKGGFLSKEGPDTASQQLQEVINSQVSQGWTFDRLGQIHILLQSGCIGGLLGRKASTAVCDQAIFRN